MIFSKTNFEGVYIIEIEKIKDERGFFARTWDKKLFQEQGLENNFVQCSVSFNEKKGTIRGMHYQLPPYEETKLVRCTCGKIYDVIIDLRPKSKTCEKWFSIELSEGNNKMIYIPKGFAHGFQTLEDQSEVFYQISEFYDMRMAGGIKWNDSAFSIKWPYPITAISEKDDSFPLYKKN